ncbi:MAG: hypothetical protein GY835_25410 [bacterium]|nr:hypothetical protein [bacterium]
MSTARKTKSGFDIVGVALCTLAALLFVYALSLFLSGSFNTALVDEREFKVMDVPVNAETAAVLAEQRAGLNEGVHWIDKDAGVVGLPIDLAKAAVVEKLQ